jgi:hypothetical protein
VKRALLLSSLLLAAAAARAAESRWTLASSELTYHADHIMHHVTGTSRAARGKGTCADDGCRFLIAAPVNSFGSGDSNRDLHMIETTRGAQFPMVVVNAAVPAVPEAADFTADLDVEFAGKKSRYASVPFHVEERSDGLLKFKGAVPATLRDFAIVPPSLLGIGIKDDIRVDVEMTWQRQ